MAINYASMPGFGDLSGDSRHPNSPDYIEPDFGLEDAEANVSLALHKNDEVAEIVHDLAESRALLNWIESNVDIPAHLIPRFFLLDLQSKRLRGMIDAEYEAMNAPMERDE